MSPNILRRYKTAKPHQGYVFEAVTSNMFTHKQMVNTEFKFSFEALRSNKLGYLHTYKNNNLFWTHFLGGLSARLNLK